MTDTQLSGSNSASGIATLRTSFQLEGELTIYTVEARKDQLLAALDQSSRLELDLSGITEVDTAGLQLLIALERETQHRGVTLTWRAPSQAVIDALEISRLRTAFDNGTLLSQPRVAPEA
jgi:anti-anti-sigma factor